MKHCVLLLIILFTISACSSDEKAIDEKKHNVITVTSQPTSTKLFYAGIVQPLKTTVITSPAEGVIQDMLFHYGDKVGEGKLLFTVSSEKFQADYKNALMQFIKSKNEFNNNQSQLTQSKFLHKNQLISDDEFKNKQSTFYNAQLALIQAQEALNTMLKQLTIQGLELKALTIENIEKITQALHNQGDSQKLRVVAKKAGVALLPTKSDGDHDTKKIGKGDQVKQGDVLAVIGDTSGLTIRFSVNEFNITQLKLGQKVTVTGTAFPDYVLQGEITGIDRQAQVSQGGMPLFPIEITVAKLTPEQQAAIHMGMSAKVEVTILSQSQISVPLAAVFEQNGLTFVNVKEPKTGKIAPVQVKTGQTTQDSVIIESNLKTGDQIVFVS